MKIFVKEQLSAHKYKTPQGYLVCTDAILARTGKQTYRKGDFFPDCADAENEIEVDRPEKEVFSDEAIASFEGMPVVVEHPYEDVTSENWKQYSVGEVRDVHRGEYKGHQVLLGNLIIRDENTIKEIESGEHTELSCGYDCDVQDEDNPYQSNIRGNHIALCDKGRAGIAKIQDSVKDINPKEGESREDFISRFMSATKEEYPDKKQRLAVAYSYWNKRNDSCKDSVRDTARTITVQCYIIKGNDILIQDRVGPAWQGLAVPGGHVKADETPYEACVRETKEETGLTVSNLQLFGTHQYTCEEDGECIALLFKTTNFNGELQSSDEGKVLWMDATDVLSMPNCAEGFQKLLANCMYGSSVNDSITKIEEIGETRFIEYDDKDKMFYIASGDSRYNRPFKTKEEAKEFWLNNKDIIRANVARDSVKDADTEANLTKALNTLKGNFHVVKRGTTFSGRKHFEFETIDKIENHLQFMDLVDKVIDRFDEVYGCVSTYNAVFKSNGGLNIVIDVDDRRAHDSVKDALKVQKLVKVIKISSLSKK